MDSSFEEALNKLRIDVYDGTVALASSHMVDVTAFLNLRERLREGTASAYAALLQEQLDDDDDRCPSAVPAQPFVPQANNNNNNNNRPPVYEQHELAKVAPMIMQGSVLQQQNPHVFGHPFDVTYYGTPLSEVHLSCTSAVGGFNLALTLHTQSSCVPDQQGLGQSLLYEAEATYLLAYELIRHTNFDLNGTMIFLYLAICNNLAEICLATGRNDEANKWKALLHQSFLPIPPAKRSPVYLHFWNLVQHYGLFVIGDDDDDDEDSEDDDDSEDEEYYGAQDALFRV